MLKAYQYRLLPSSAQGEKIAQHFGCARHVYNWAVETRKSHYEQTGKTLSKRQLQDQLVHVYKPAHPWLKEVNSQSLLAALFHAIEAYDRFFKGQAKFPRFKSRKNHWQSYQCPQHVNVKFESGCIQLPILGNVKAKLHRSFEGKIKTCTIKRTPHQHYLISVLVDDGVAQPIAKEITEENTLGVDVGIIDFAVASNGMKVGNPRFLDKSLPGLREQYQCFSRKQKGSKNREKSRLSLSKKHYHVAQQRKHFLHEAANKLLSENQVETIALEDLNIKGMLKNKKLSRHISNVAWSSFARMIEYKTKWQGRNVIYCNRFAPSSKLCLCGYKHKDLKLRERVWVCPACHRIHDRDLLAAQNIKQFALADAVGNTVCVKQFLHDNTRQRECHGERSSEKLDRSQEEAPTRIFVA
jgi:putative transposase